MKKYYLPILTLGLLSGTLFSQNTYVTGNAKVKVQPNTLFYHGGDFVIKSGATAASVVENSGNIRIQGNFTNTESPSGLDGTNFVNTYTGATNYGQTIIRQTGNASGMLTMVKPTISPTQFTWGQFAIPYTFTNVQTAFQKLFGGTTFVGSGSRYNHSVMRWDNLVKPEYDHVSNGGVLNPTDYVILNLTDANLQTFMGAGGTPVQYGGTPANKTHTVNFNTAIYPGSAVPWTTWQNQRNSHREQYKTYIEEHIRIASSPEFGKYYFQFGNPYTSNIDLSRIGLNESSGDGVYISDLAGVVKITGMQWVEGQGVIVAGVQKVVATWSAGTWAGNREALLARPFEPFYIATNGVNTGNVSFTFSDGLKTFSNLPANVGNTTNSLGKMGIADEEETMYSEGNVAEDRANGFLNATFASQAGRTSFYQLGLNLHTEEGEPTGNIVYVVVDAKSQLGINQPLESEYDGFQKGFFLSQENAEGLEVETPNRTMQINAIPPRYVSKPIPLFFSKTDEDMSGYYLKADLFYKSIFNQLTLEDVNFADGNSFFFYDKDLDMLVPITTDFSYYIDRPEDNLSSRYVIYWNGGPQNRNEKMGVSDETAGFTKVYKDGEQHKIRFDKSWSSADIAVYDLTGRLILKSEGVKTDSDYALNLPNTLAYVVKIQSNTGETVTQKILR